jgi:phage terminase large subunit-like protein
VKAGLVQACDSLQLFGFKLLARQRKIMRAIEKGPRLHVVMLGRRSGKSTLSALIGLWCCLLRPELLSALRPGERGYAAAVATNAEQARVITKAAASIVERSPLLAPLIESVTADEILFRNGTGFRAFPCTARGVRGGNYFCVLFDEAAHMLDTDGNQAAGPMLDALLPGTATFKNNARIILSSTPYGEDGVFWDYYQRAASGEFSDGIAHFATTPEVRPDLAEFLVQEEARDPDAYRQEYLCQPGVSGEPFLAADLISDAVLDRDELSPQQAREWIAGLDPVFSSDPFGLAIVCRDPLQRQRLQLGLVRAWKPSRRKPGSFEERRAIEDAVLEDVARVCLQYRARVVTDQYQATAIVDFLRKAGLSVKTIPMTAQTKTDTFVALRARLNLGGLELYEHSELLAEMRRLRSKYRAGAAMVENPRTGKSHGDMAQALALAVYEHDRHGLGGSTSTWRQNPDGPRGAAWGVIDVDF